ncbi:Neutral ceramidase [Acorus calamus]|uniref:Neutral ceramidase n=1 Tax=Acorus calamus TaxID=4465 RepID=A0AAV9FCY5_ACOCL|nr:Neutral ceramidase [Acorus calamus]
MKSKHYYWLIVCSVWALSNVVDGEDYLIGLGSYDMTGPASNVNMMGYANMGQDTSGVHFRLRARAFIVADGVQGPRLAFVNLDAGMASQLVTINVLEKLKSRQ